VTITNVGGIVTTCPFYYTYLYTAFGVAATLSPHGPFSKMQSSDPENGNREKAM